MDSINIMPGATISGDITSDWTHFQTDEGIFDKKDSPDKETLGFHYNGTIYDYTDYIPDLVTYLNVKGDFNYSDTIHGADNMKLNVQSGSFYYGGKADVISVQIDENAALLGSGTYTVNDMSDKIAADFNDPDMGKVINLGTFGATSGDVQILGGVDETGEAKVGNLVSKGTIAVAATDNGAAVYQLLVSGTADITGSNLTAGAKNKPLLNKTYAYLTAQGGITGNIDTSALSDYVEASGTVNGTVASFTTKQVKTLQDTAELTSNESSVAKAFDQVALTQMQQNNAIAQQSANVFYNDVAGVKKLMQSAATAERTQLLSQSAMSNLTADSIYSRLDTNAFEGTVTVPVKVLSLDGENQTVNSNIPMVLDASNNLWFKLFRGFEHNGGTSGVSDLNNSSFGGIVGYDKEMKSGWRLGGFFGYGKTHYSSNALQGDSRDWRVGFYTGARHGDWEYQGLVGYGNNHYDLDGYTSDGAPKLNSDFKAKVWDVAFKAKYTLPNTKEKTWQVKPYGKVEYTHTSQDGYSETGENAFAKNIDSASNSSTRAELGVEFKRNLTATSGWGGAIGYKRVLSGVNPQLNGSFIGGTESFTLETENDRNYLTYGLNVHTSLGGKWTGQAEFRGERSSNNHREIYSVSAKYHF